MSNSDSTRREQAQPQGGAQIPAQHHDFLADHAKGVLVTLKRDGRPQLSNVLYDYDRDTATARVSVTADRAKTRNAERDPRVSLHVSSDDFWAYVVADGEAVLGDTVRDPHDAAADELVDLYRALAGEHDAWEKYRQVQVAERRLVLTLKISHTYGMVPR
jgi:PPOX class probable F420-dependent enzyme